MKYKFTADVADSDACQLGAGRPADRFPRCAAIGRKIAAALLAVSIVAMGLFDTATAAPVPGGPAWARLVHRGAVQLADTTVTYTYDPNGNRLAESGQANPTAISGTAVGLGMNFLGMGGVDTFIRSPFGHLGVFEVSTAGAIVASQWLNSGSGALPIDSATTAVGTGFNFGSTDGHDIFVRTANGQLNVWEFNQSGLSTYSQVLATSLTIDTATSVVGNGFNFAGLGGSDLFLRDVAGDLNVWEIGSNGALLGTPALSFNGNLFTVDTRSRVISTGLDSLNGLHDFALRYGNGQTRTYDLGPNSALQLASG